MDHEIDPSNTLVLLDSSNFMFVSWHSANSKIKKLKNREIEEKELPFFYEAYFNQLNWVFTKFGNFVLCDEGDKSLEWRKAIFPGYKANREEYKQSESYALFKKARKQFPEVWNYYPLKKVVVQNAEADDVIYAIAMHELKKNIVIISSDKDLTQIMNFRDGVRQYNPLTGLYYGKNEYIIEQKAIVGDPSDGIPGLYRIGEKTFEKMMKDRSFWNEKMIGNRDTYELFKSIVDLRRIPPAILKEAVDKYNKVEYNTFLPDEIEAAFFDMGLATHMYRWSDTKEEIRRNLKAIENSEQKIEEEELEW